MKTALQIIIESALIAISIGLFAFAVFAIGYKLQGVYRTIRASFTKFREIQHMNYSEKPTKICKH